MVLRTRVEAHPPQRRELVLALLRWAESVRADDGATACHLYEDLELPGTFALTVEWRAEEALQAHLHSEPFGVLQGAMEVLAKPARFEIVGPEGRSIPASVRAAR